jgi:hypothetical protein
MMPDEIRPASTRARERRRARRRVTGNRVLVAVAIIVAFAIGVALGQALHDNPRPGGEQTSVHTIPPLTQQSR